MRPPPPRVRGLRLQVWRHVQRVLLGALEGHRRALRGRGDRGGLVPRVDAFGPRAEVRGDARGQDDRRARGKEKSFEIFLRGFL